MRKVAIQITCRQCGKKVTTYATHQLYCVDCATKRNWKRKLDWQNKHSKILYQKHKYKIQKRIKVNQEQLKEIGKKSSQKTARNIIWYPRTSINLVNYSAIKIPFTWGFSKNRQWAFNPKGYVYLKQEARAERDALIWQLKNLKIKMVNGKVWIDLLIQKPSAKGDAVNFVDSICDCIQKAIGVNDSWYSIRRLDWEIVKDNPQIIIGIGQEHWKPRQICSYCGQILPYSKFTGKKKIGYECKDCLKKLRSKKK